MIAPALSAVALAAAAQAPCTAPGFHDWDFWLGEWTVTDPAGKPQGRNRIVRAPGGCAIEEHWTSAGGGGGGDSFNVYDPVRGTWTQLWQGKDEVVRLEGRLDAEGAMRMEGTIAYLAGGPEKRFRGIWTPLPDGAVRQEFFEHDAATGTWSNWFTGVYRRAD